jgi:hypothetical protein
VIAADFNALSFVTHSFAGAASVVQVNDLTEKSREIERQARAGWSGVFRKLPAWRKKSISSCWL